MINFTITIPDELKERIEKHPEVNWSELARTTYATRLQELEKSEEMGELLEKILKPVLSIDEKAKNSLAFHKREEIARFSKKWGAPLEVETIQAPPYVKLEKRVNLRASVGEPMVLVRNFWNRGRLDDKLQAKDADPKDWKDGDNMITLIKSFSSQGFQVKDHPLVYSEFDWIFPEKSVRERREQARRFTQQKSSVHGLFAFDNEDAVFIGYRVQRW